MNSKVLIIDDSDVDRSIISNIIRMNVPNIEIIESDDGVNIMDIVISQSVVMCILDLKMPEVDGIEVLKSLKAEKKTADVPVIVCTGIIDSSMMECALSLGAYDYFTKPFSSEQMKYSLPLKVRNAVDLRKRTVSILKMSQLDDLTGIFNRRYFKDQLDRLQNENVNIPVSIIICDVNGLKLVNDAYGNCAGDRLLKKTAQMMVDCLPKDAVCARWGGDEFVALFEGVERTETERYVKKLQTSAKSVFVEGLELSLAVGSETLVSNSESILKTLKTAEDAMFRNKILDNGSVRNSMIATIVHTLNEKNTREEAHSRRVSELCVRLGQALGMSDVEINDLRVIGLLHDIGKIAIDERILDKPGRLTDAEYAEIKRHPEIGYRILSTSKEMGRYLDVILSHHERIDGKGYPNGLSGDQIPLMAKILSIADSYDAMTCYRPYRDTKHADEAAEELRKHSGTQFDIDVARVFIEKVVYA